MGNITFTEVSLREVRPCSEISLPSLTLGKRQNIVSRLSLRGRARLERHGRLRSPDTSRSRNSSRSRSRHLGYRASTLSFSKVRAILDGSSQIFPWHLDSLSILARRCLLLMRSRIVLLQSAPLNTSVTRPPSITSHAQGLCWAFACPVRPALFRWERSSSWRCAP